MHEENKQTPHRKAPALRQNLQFSFYKTTMLTSPALNLCLNNIAFTICYFTESLLATKSKDVAESWCTLWPFLFKHFYVMSIWSHRLIHFLSLCLAASYGAYPVCKGCSVCSRDNGCVNCQPKLFLFLRRERMRQYGECLHDCPAGYYGMRSPEINMCSSKTICVNSPNLSHTPHFLIWKYFA